MAGSHGRFYRPDWVMLGVPHDDKVWVYASNNMTQAELRTEIESGQEWGDDYLRVRQPDHVVSFILTAQMRNMVMVQGDDYADALRKLLEHWKPGEKSQDPGRQPAVPGRSAALTAPATALPGGRQDS